MTSERLSLVAQTPALAAAERAGIARLAAALGVAPPASWPPDLYDAADLERLARLLDEPANEGWALHYLLTRAEPIELVGVAGFAGGPDAAGMVEVGYAILAPFRRRGFASEALAALVAHAWRDPRVRSVAADTLAGLEASIGVLRNNGFQSVEPIHPGTIRFALARTGAGQPASAP